MAGINLDNDHVNNTRDRFHDISFVGCEINEHLAKLLGPQFLEYREKWIAAERCLQLPEFPLFLQVETVDGCNLRCNMCFRRLVSSQKMRNMSTDLFQKIIDEVKLEKCPSMCLNGNNEPLLDPHLAERIAMAHAAGVIDTRINTNGMLLTDEWSKRLIKAGLTRLSVSIDAARSETYDKIRIGGNLARVSENISNFIKIRKQLGASLPVLRVTFVILKENQNEQDEFVQCWKDKADYISFQQYVPHTQNDLPLEMGGAVNFHSDDIICSQPFERLLIDVEGNAFPCCSPLGSKMLLGSLSEQTLQSIWKSERENHIRHCLSTRCLAGEPTCALCRGNSCNEKNVS